MLKIISKSEKETLNLGKQIARQLKPGDLVALEGNLGAGKTVLTKGIGQELGVKQVITSPTFVLFKPYPIKNKEKPKLRWFCHFDAYRFDSAQELEAIGGQEWLENKQAIKVIEWADKIKSLLPKTKIVIKLKARNKQNEREVSIFGLDL